MTDGRPRLNSIRIKNYRSIGEWITIRMPRAEPLVLIGENNAGKSNILRALTFTLGEGWPGNHDPDDHEFFNRSPEGIEIVIQVHVSGLYCPKCPHSAVSMISWRYDRDADQPSQFRYQASACDHTFVNNDLRRELICMSVGVDRDLSYQLSYASKWTTLSKLMHRFHKGLTDDEDRVERLKEFYDGLVKTFYEVKEFRDFAEILKGSTAEFGRNMPYGLGIDFSAYDASNFFRSLRLFPSVGDEPRTYEELGTGQEQVLAIAFSYAYAKAFGGEGLILAVEEPEAHLHPLAQEWVAKKLREVALSGVQVVLTTHSPYFINMARPGSTVVVRKEGEGQPTSIIQLTPSDLAAKLVDMGAPSDIESASLGDFYENASTNEIKAALFARGCVLVEGDTEVYGLAALFERIGVDLVRLGIAIVSVGGITNIAKWVRYFRSHEIPVYAVFDTDSNASVDKRDRSRKAREDVLTALGGDDDPNAGDGGSDVIRFGDGFAAFDSDYEGALRATFGDAYSALEERAREVVGSSKPLIARYVARKLPAPDDDPGEDRLGWGSIRKLAARIESTCVGPTTAGSREGDAQPA